MFVSLVSWFRVSLSLLYAISALLIPLLNTGFYDDPTSIVQLMVFGPMNENIFHRLSLLSDAFFYYLSILVELLTFRYCRADQDFQGPTKISTGRYTITITVPYVNDRGSCNLHAIDSKSNLVPLLVITL